MPSRKPPAKKARKNKTVSKTAKKAAKMLNPRVGTSIRLIPGLRLYVSWGASGFHFNMGGNPATIAKGIKKKLADSSSRKVVDAEAEVLDAMLDEEDYDTDVASGAKN